MGATVDKSELQAILEASREGAATCPASVEPRDFRRPRRLSAERLEGLARKVAAAQSQASAEVSSVLRMQPRIELGSVGEVDVREVLEGLEEPFLVQCFSCNGSGAWAVWDGEAAVRAVEHVVSGHCGDDEEEARSQPHAPRKLSPSEIRVVEGLFARLVPPFTRALGLSTGPGRMAQDREELLIADQHGHGPDPRRLRVHLSLEGPGGASDLCLYLPGGRLPKEDGEQGAAGAPTPLPDHLDDVMLTVLAYLGSADVALQELLALEVGDVIPLGVEAGSPVELYVEDRPYALASWGRWRDNLAVRIRAVDARAGASDRDEPPPMSDETPTSVRP